MEEQEFNLCSEPWIKVMEKDYRVKNVSLREALLNAECYRGLAGETETQNIAVLRLLLAVLHTVFSRQDEKGQYLAIDSAKEARRRWKAIWDEGKFPEEPVINYFQKWYDRFWLFDTRYPFYQVVGIDGTSNPAKKMNGELVESSNKKQLFSLRSGRQKDVLDYGEAARWLVYLHAYDDTAAKKPSPKLCHVGNLGIVAAKGDTLFETLMLNMTMLKDGIEVWGEAKPVWERDTPCADKLKEIPLPDNQPELLTMQCRRVLLQRSGDVVTGYIEAAGEYISEESAFAEQMTFWRKKAKDKETIEFYPKLHDKSRQMWRDLSALLGTADNELKPGVVSWITMLQSKKLLPRGRFVAFETVGVEYGNMCCGVADEFSDTLDIHASLLDEIGRTWQIYILNEIERCDKLANAVGLLGLRIDRAAGGDGKSAEEQAKEQAYYRLDVPFRQWLMQVDPEQDAEEQSSIRMKWRNTAVEIIKKLGRELVDKAGSNAIAGRNVTEKIKNNETKMIHYSVPEAFNLFLYQISQIDK